MRAAEKLEELQGVAVSFTLLPEYGVFYRVGCLYLPRAGDLAYQNVTYEYEPGSAVLKDVNFNVPGGQTIAFVVRIIGSSS